MNNYLATEVAVGRFSLKKRAADLISTALSLILTDIRGLKTNEGNKVFSYLRLNLAA